jgi:WD40 repeat protein
MITPDGRRAVLGSSDQTLRVWDLGTGEQIANFTGEAVMCSCAVTSDGQTICPFNPQALCVEFQPDKAGQIR